MERIVVAQGYRQGYRRMIYCSNRVQDKFVVQTTRWELEVTFAWLRWSSRLCKDFEVDCLYAEHMLRLAAITLIIKQVDNFLFIEMTGFFYIAQRKGADPMEAAAIDQIKSSLYARSEYNLDPPSCHQSHIDQSV